MAVTLYRQVGKGKAQRYQKVLVLNDGDVCIESFKICLLAVSDRRSPTRRLTPFPSTLVAVVPCPLPVPEPGTLN
jgi:hypothetical protein